MAVGFFIKSENISYLRFFKKTCLSKNTFLIIMKNYFYFEASKKSFKKIRNWYGKSIVFLFLMSVKKNTKVNLTIGTFKKLPKKEDSK